MPSRFLARGESSSSVQQQLPFTGDAVNDADFSREEAGLPPASGSTRSHPIRARATSNASTTYSSSFRQPARSFVHHASHSVNDNPQYSSHGVRERTQELASYALDSDSYQETPSHRYSNADSDTVSSRRAGFLTRDADVSEGRTSSDSFGTEAIEEEVGEEPESPETVICVRPSYGLDGPRDGQRRDSREPQDTANRVPDVIVEDTDPYSTEETPLLPKARLSSIDSHQKSGKSSPSKTSTSSLGSRIGETFSAGRDHVVGAGRSLLNPKTYTADALKSNGQKGLQTVSAVFLGLLLNVLDALSYGYILFPLGNAMFSQTGPDGISIFFVSCIVSQLCYSLGLSVFRGGVGSEMIEVVPFFHKMAFSIMAQMEDKSQEAILATVIVSYCLSSIVTGIIFLLLGAFKLGNLVSFFPRHILIGCIGGVGFFLFVTGIEVSARLEGNLNYDLDTLRKLFSGDTVHLWLIPLALSIVMIVLKMRFKSPFVLPSFFISVFAIFYFLVAVIPNFSLEQARNSGWVFEKPEAGVPFYRFYSYFKFGSVDGKALASTIPTMFALSFFGVIHVPINVPALAASVKEDDFNINRELIAHGISNTLSGFVGSIQNYLVYANSYLFIANGGNSRTSGVLLAAATAGVWIAGPAMIGFIPVCVVGALIFMLGIDLLKEAVWDPFGKCHRLEYLTIWAIVLIMGLYDFVTGIVAGILMACLFQVLLSSRTSAIRATYSGEIAESTVRRPRADRRYLDQVRGQYRVFKLSGFLFFGTIVSVEQTMRALVDKHQFQQQPLTAVIVDFSHVTDMDFSSSEGLERINRLLSRTGVKMIICGFSFSSKVGRSLQAVGLLDDEKNDQETPPPRVFEDLNTALEAIENELLESFYKHLSTMARKTTPPMGISSNGMSSGANSTSSPPPSLRANPLDPEWQSPRRGAQLRAAATTMREQGADSPLFAEHGNLSVPSKWKRFAQPIKIILQTFEDVSDKNEDFWQVAAPYFERKEYAAGSVLYSRGDEPDGFYVLEKGRFRTEYELDQGHFYEVILPGTTCGELPFFSETDRTGTVAAENDSVAWLLTRQKFKELESKDREVASELLKVGLKLTKERMDAITSYVLVTAS